MDILPETHFERLDRLQMEHKHEMEKIQAAQTEETKRAKIKRSEERQGTYQTVAITGGIVAVIVTIILAFWDPWEDKPAPGQDKESLREISCYEHGGGWVPKDQLISGADSGLCVFPGDKVNQ